MGVMCKQPDTSYLGTVTPAMRTHDVQMARHELPWHCNTGHAHINTCSMHLCSAGSLPS